MVNRKRNRKTQLYLKINANCASELYIDNANSKKSVNPLLVASLNNYTKKTSRKLNTVSPSWDNVLLLPLNENDYSPVLSLIVWDKHRRYKNYLGECRLSLSDVFSNGVYSDLKWYKLHSDGSYKGFVTGSILLSFELVIKERNQQKESLDSKNSSTIDVPALAVNDNLFGSSQTLDVVDSEEVFTEKDAKDGEKKELFQKWVQSLLAPPSDISRVTTPNEQGFYQSGAIDDISEIESIAPSLLSNATKSNISNSVPVSDSELSDDSSSALNSRTDKNKSKNLVNEVGSRLTAKLNDKEPDSFQIYNSNMLGVIFLEIVSATDLPPLKNFTRTSFDVDPFVVVTFGKRTFRTSWKRHTLNPVFNERLAFEIHSYERNFDIQFAILDKDSLSFHDEVGDISLKMSKLAEMAKYEPKEDGNTDVENEENLGVSDLNATQSDQAESENEDSVMSHEGVTLSKDPNSTPHIKKRVFKRRITFNYADTSKFKTLDLALNIKKEKYIGKYKPTLKIRACFQSYDSIRRNFWQVLLDQYQLKDGCFDYIELISLLDTLGCEDSDEIVGEFFEKNKKSAWEGDTFSIKEIADFLDDLVTSNNDKIFRLEKCPICNEKKLTKKQDKDIITHVAICASKDWSIVSKLLLQSYDTPQIATRRWFSKVLIKLTYGKYKLGSNSANILVQDRITGIVMEEKMGVYVRLGIRLLYKGFDSARKRRIRSLLKSLSIKQGQKFDLPQSKNDIKSFIKFHSLDLSDCVEQDPTKYATFNEFFYRKLKPGARPIAGDNDNRIVVSPADCRSTYYSTVNDATKFWIKGRNFSLAKLFGGNIHGLENTDLYSASKCSLAIFRLAPQDYHRFHSPVAGKISMIKHIDGEYYTVNPMAIRSELDVYGENVRTLVAIETKEFGTVIMACIGAMMVGSIVLSVDVGQTVERGDEIGYFKFGGSTVVLLIEAENFEFDQDLINNSKASIETLVRVGHSVGHSKDITECGQKHLDFTKQTKAFKLKLIRELTGGDGKDGLSNWEADSVSLDGIRNEDIEKINLESKE